MAPRLIRHDLCFEALRLTTLITRHDAVNSPKVHALAALMLFHCARLASRVDGEGGLLLLENQDRLLWDRQLTQLALLHLERAASGEELTRYHLEVEIAACHALASTYAETDWARIVELYERLLELAPSPVVRVNHAVAVSRLCGPLAGIRLVEAVRAGPNFAQHHLAQAILGQLWLQTGEPAKAMPLFTDALTGRWTEPERNFLRARCDDCRRTEPPSNV